MPASRVIKKCLPVSPGKNSHFTIRHNGGSWWVFCEAPDGTLVPADSPHQELVALVNELKASEGIAPGGGFSINEHFQVIARMAAPPGYKQNSIYVVDISTGLVKEYTETITFQSGALDPKAEPAEGDPWVGPLCGATYRFVAPGNRKPPNHNLDEIWTEIEGQIDLLSTHINPNSYPPKSGPLVAFLAALRRQLPQGGRFRVNEHGRAFTANENVFIGIAPLKFWFPPLSITG
jgi:hypothetical protein